MHGFSIVRTFTAPGPSALVPRYFLPPPHLQHACLLLSPFTGRSLHMAPLNWAQGKLGDVPACKIKIPITRREYNHYNQTNLPVIIMITNQSLEGSVIIIIPTKSNKWVHWEQKNIRLIWQTRWASVSEVWSTLPWCTRGKGPKQVNL